MSESNKNPQSISSDTFTASARNIDLNVGEKPKQENFDKRVEEILVPLLNRTKAEGIRIGVLAASKAIMNYVNDTSKPLLKRIELIKKYCNVAMKDEKSFLSKGLNEETVENEKQVSEVEENE